VTPLPRSALLALWARPTLTGQANLGALLRAVQGDDEPHEVDASAASGLGTLAAPGRLAELVQALRAAGAHGLRVALPAPGDLLGLPGPAAANLEAVDAGECAVVVGGPPLLLVPVVEEFGSVYEVGHLVTWRVLDCNPPLAPPSLSVAQAERELREGLVEATELLDDLDVSRWRPEAADRIASLRGGKGPGDLLPPGTDPRAARVLDLAWRVRGIVELAREDDGAAVNAFEATRRDEPLRALEQVSRRALVAAINASLERVD
jgi:hypothetical protein